jgi:type I restriction enzyme S subunit
MKLRKDKWEEVKFGEIAKASNLSCNPVEDNIERFVAGDHMITDELKIKNWGIVKDVLIGPAFHRKFLPNQILYGSRRTYLRKVAISDFEGVCANTTFVIDVKENKTTIPFLAAVMQSGRFTEFSIDNSKGSTNPFINWKDIAKYEISLPPLSEQKQIASLFQSIETAMEQVDEQEKNLKALQKTLINGLLSKETAFGNLLNSKNCMLTTFGEIAVCDKKYPEHNNEVTRFIGLENIESENFQLQGWGEIANGTTFSKRFAKGDVLFGKRRAYLKKVAVADFDGICSGDILVIRAKAKKMMQGLLPYYISSEAFIQHAVSTSAGSLSPRTKWKDLSELEVSVPDLKVQEKILEVLQQINNTVDQLKQQKTTLKNLKQKLLSEILG